MTDYSDDALARAIYGIADAKMAEHGKKLPVSEDVFSVLTAATPDGVSYPAMKPLGNEDFLDTAFLLLLGRPIDDSTKSAWKGNFPLPKEQFQTAVLNSILGSAEYQRNCIPLRDCPLAVSLPTPQLTVCVVNQGMPDRLVRVYQKLPQPLRKVAKKIAGKGQ